MKFLLAALLFVIAAKALAKPEVVVRETNEVSGAAQVTLKDIADFTEINDADKTKLGQIVIIDTWKPGQTIRLSNHQISQQILIEMEKLKSENFAAPAFKIPANIQIENSAGIISSANIEKRLSEYLKNQCSVCQYQIRDIAAPKVANMDAHTQWDIGLNNFQAHGSFNIPLYVHFTEGEKTYWIQGLVNVYRDVPVATRQLNFGERVQPSDFEIKLVDVTHVRDGIPSGDEVLGQALQRSVPANQPILRGYLKKEPALNKGQIVKVISENNLIEVTSTAQAEENGFVGDLVKLKNTETQKMITGLVVQKGVVKLQ